VSPACAAWRHSGSAARARGPARCGATGAGRGGGPPLAQRARPPTHLAAG